MSTTGPQGEQGERGEQGEQGIQGFQGVQGGQGRPTPGPKGDPGHRGPIGRMGNTPRLAVILFVVTTLFVTAGWWKNERDSCLRGNGVRQLLVAKYALDHLRALAISRHESGGERTVNVRFAAYYGQLERNVTPLQCGGPFPSTDGTSPKVIQRILTQASQPRP